MGLSNNKFKFDSALNIYKKPDCAIGYSDGFKSEWYILDSIRKARDISSESVELLSYIKDWPSCYHLNISRSNILRAINLPSNSSVLEIGSGCGAITRYLGEHFKYVDAIEGSEFRAKITRERCRDLKNVTVYNTNVDCIDFPSEQYDVVTLIGVLEYSKIYMKTDPKEAPLKLLKIVNKSLKKGGIAIIAIENKIGLKYWNGYGEDHVNVAFESINDYPSDYGPVTFTKSEIKDLLFESGFKSVKILGCFPDYKFANTIIDTDASATHNLYNWIDFPFSTTYRSKNLCFHEGLALKTVFKGKLLGEFANSFLIVAAKDKDNQIISKMDWMSKKFSIKRRPEFRVITTLKRNNVVEKRRLSNHNGVIVHKYNGITIKHTVSEESWVEGELLTFKISNFLFQDDFENKVLNLTKKMHNELINLYSCNKFDDENYPFVNGKSFDFIFRNIIEDQDGGFHQIDMEWDVSPITAEFVLYRAIKNDVLLVQHPWIKKYVKNEDKFILETIRAIYPQYCRERLMMNYSLDIKIRNIIANNVQYSCRMSDFYRIGNNKIVMAVWRRLPLGVKKSILSLMQNMMS